MVLGQITSPTEWSIRPAVSGDLAFIYATWVNSYQKDSALGRSCKASTFFHEYNQIVDSILDRPETQVLVAVKTDEPHVIFGYLVFEPHRLHYAFVKRIFHRRGIARSLLEASGVSTRTLTHMTDSMRPILDQHPEWSFNPFSLYERISHGTS